MALKIRKLLALAAALAIGLTGVAEASYAHHSHHKRHHVKHHVKHHAKHHSAIPQHNGGDHDADNNGGPSDGDGNT
jgi:hypothetical protein